MRQATKSALRQSLAETIEQWFEDLPNDIERPIVGNDAHHIMATAAIAVLEGIDDAAEYLKSEGALDPDY